MINRILIVDDEPLLLQGLGKALEADMAEVSMAQTGEMALRELSSRAYQLCFLDVHLPDMNGLDVMKKVKELSPQTGIIIMTAGVLSETMKKTIEKNAYMFIAKPFDLLQVRMVAKRALERAVR
jgi:DNA-binding NtrC family response regulator